MVQMRGSHTGVWKCCIIKNKYMVFVSDFWHRGPKILGTYYFLSAVQMILEGNIDSLWGVGIVARKTKHMVRGFQLSALPTLTFREGEELEIEFNHNGR